ncbi:MAG: transposase, partial [Candidatus Lokiarchaeota archaeon]|nr:transposase [Candidatus Lokiarchaeota archaeon]
RFRGKKYFTTLCYKCGKVKKRPIFERIINCDCGNRIDRDLNSGINIMISFLSTKYNYEFLSHQSSVDEESFLSHWDGFLRYTDQSVIEAIVRS